MFRERTVPLCETVWECALMQASATFRKQIRRALILPPLVFGLIAAVFSA